MVVGSSRRVDDRAGVTSPDTVWVGRFEARSVMGVVECQKSSGSKPFRGDCPVSGDGGILSVVAGRHHPSDRHCRRRHPRPRRRVPGPSLGEVPTILGEWIPVDGHGEGRRYLTTN
jgi:hypothetical protein